MNKFEDIRGVAFDLDGTLVDSAPGLAAAVDMALYAEEAKKAVSTLPADVQAKNPWAKPLRQVQADLK